MPALPPIAVLLLVINLGVAYLSGITEGANIVAPIVSARAISPRRALVLAAAGACLAPALFGIGVAHTFGAGILSPALATVPVVLSATLSLLLWRLFTTRLGIPTSATHALIGALTGAGLVGAGASALNLAGLTKAIAALFLSPAAGLVISLLITRLTYRLVRRASPRINTPFRFGQVLTALLLALSWGANDAQKTIGLLALCLSVTAGQPFGIPLWVTVVSTLAVALGALTGGWRIIRTLGGRFYRIRPITGLSAQVASALVMFSATAFGAPVSTTQVISTAIMGAGAAERVNKVRWQVAVDIMWAWFLTIPATALLGAALTWVLQQVL